MGFFQRDAKDDTQNLYLPLESVDECLERSRKETVLILKHSTTCPISRAGKNQVDRFLKEQPIAAYLVIVQQQRPLSNQIAERLQIKHESPQVIALKNGAAVKVFNHYEIAAETIRKAIE